MPRTKAEIAKEYMAISRELYAEHREHSDKARAIILRIQELDAQYAAKLGMEEHRVADYCRTLLEASELVDEDTEQEVAPPDESTYPTGAETSS